MASREVLGYKHTCLSSDDAFVRCANRPIPLIRRDNSRPCLSFCMSQMPGHMQGSSLRARMASLMPAKDRAANSCTHLSADAPVKDAEPNTVPAAAEDRLPSHAPVSSTQHQLAKAPKACVPLTSEAAALRPVVEQPQLGYGWDGRFRPAGHTAAVSSQTNSQPEPPEVPAQAASPGAQERRMLQNAAKSIANARFPAVLFKHASARCW